MSKNEGGVFNEVQVAAFRALASGGTVIVNLQLHINRLEEAIRNYRILAGDMPNTDALIDDAERGLSAEDRERIG